MSLEHALEECGVYRSVHLFKGHVRLALYLDTF